MRAISSLTGMMPAVDQASFAAALSRPGDSLAERTARARKSAEFSRMTNEERGYRPFEPIEPRA